MVPDDTKLEAETREAIDKNLEAAGWVVQDKKRINLTEKLGVAVREMDTDTGPADYMLFVDGAACGIIEAKREGAELIYANGRTYAFDRMWGSRTAEAMELIERKFRDRGISFRESDLA